MTDSFSLLNEPRRPWLDAGALKQKFLPLSSAAHPDRTHNAPEAEKTIGVLAGIPLLKFRLSANTVSP